MATSVFSLARDLYVVLLLFLMIDMIPGNDILDPWLRKLIVGATVVLLASKLVQPFFAPTGRQLPHSASREKRSATGKGAGLEWASVEMQGWRPAMEDAVLIVPELPDPLSGEALFAVFDGHGGSQVSRIASQEFPKVLAACATNLERLRVSGTSNGGGESAEETPVTAKEASDCSGGGDAAAAQESDGGTANRVGTGSNSESSRDRCTQVGKLLHVALLSMDALLRRGGEGRTAVGRPRSDPLGRLEGNMESKNAFNLVGSTALIALIEHAGGRPAVGTDASNGDAIAAKPEESPRLAIANCGDSRAVLCRSGRAIELSTDHKPELKVEEERIRRAGGLVAQAGPCHRVDGWGLNLSRALGDFHYKARTDLPAEQQKVIAVPEIRTLELEEGDEFVILGCDGIFELNSSQGAVDIVRTSLANGSSLQVAVQELVDRSCSKDLMATRGRGGDNCSAVVFRRLKS